MTSEEREEWNNQIARETSELMLSFGTPGIPGKITQTDYYADPSPGLQEKYKNKMLSYRFIRKKNLNSHITRELRKEIHVLFDPAFVTEDEAMEMARAES